jgi:hypothetical protein
MPGTFASRPNRATPVTFSRLSSRNVDLPMILNCEGSLSGTSTGTGMVRALSTSSPYVNARLPGPMTRPFSARREARSTFQVSAAAANNISRAVAPAFRSRSHSLATLMLPPVNCMPNCGWL